MQKPAAHFCGRVSGEAIHFGQNTMFDRTSQTKIQLIFHMWKSAPAAGHLFLWLGGYWPVLTPRPVLNLAVA
jgi:hypothetical protein